MLRLVTCTLVLALAPACDTFLVPQNPKVSVGATGAMLELSGRGRMQTPTGGGLQNNDFVDIGAELSMSDLDFGFGGSAAWGDGFAGAEAHFLYWTSQNPTAGVLRQDFGDLRRGDAVTSESRLNQFRLHYFVKVVEHDLEGVTLRAGAGLGLHHNSFHVESRAQGAPRSQTIDFDDDGIPMLLARGQAEWKPFRGTIEGAFSRGDWGDIDGTVLDLQAKLEYRLQKGIWIWGGYRRYDLPVSGNKQGVGFEFDMDLAGWVFGIRVDF